MASVARAGGPGKAGFSESSIVKMTSTVAVSDPVNCSDSQQSPAFAASGLTGEQLDYTWVCDIHAGNKDNSFVFCSNIEGLECMVSGSCCIFQGIVYDISSITRSLTFDGSINLRICFGINTREHPEIPGGWEVKFHDLCRNGDKLCGLIEASTWGRCPVTIASASALSSSERAERLGARQHHRSPPVTLAHVDATRPLSWTCGRCGIKREPDSNESSDCARRQTFIGESAPSFYRRFSSNITCGRTLCGLSREQHFRSGSVLLCPRHYECCHCLASLSEAEGWATIDPNLGWCLQCRRRHAGGGGGYVDGAKRQRRAERRAHSPGSSRDTSRRTGGARSPTTDQSPHDSDDSGDSDDSDHEADELQVTAPSHRRRRCHCRPRGQ